MPAEPGNRSCHMNANLELDGGGGPQAWKLGSPGLNAVINLRNLIMPEGRLPGWARPRLHAKANPAS